MCIEKGMISGHTKVIDSTSVKANASMNSLELKVPKEELESYLSKVRVQSFRDCKVINNASKEQQILTTNAQELKAIQTRNKKWSKDQNQQIKAVNIPQIRHITVLLIQMHTLV